MISNRIFKVVETCGAESSRPPHHNVMGKCAKMKDDRNVPECDDFAVRQRLGTTIAAAPIGRMVSAPEVMHRQTQPCDRRRRKRNFQTNLGVGTVFHQRAKNRMEPHFHTYLIEKGGQRLGHPTEDNDGKYARKNFICHRRHEPTADPGMPFSYRVPRYTEWRAFEECLLFCTSHLAHHHRF